MMAYFSEEKLFWHNRAAIDTIFNFPIIYCVLDTAWLLATPTIILNKWAWLCVSYLSRIYNSQTWQIWCQWVGSLDKGASTKVYVYEDSMHSTSHSMRVQAQRIN